jgi:hypothetical protein
MTDHASTNRLLALSATSFPTTPPLDYLDAAASAGFDAVGLRLYRSPSLQNPFWPVVGNADLVRQVKERLTSHGLQLWEIFSVWLQPELEFDALRPILAFGADLGARYLLVIGDDAEWSSCSVDCSQPGSPTARSTMLHRAADRGDVRPARASCRCDGFSASCLAVFCSVSNGHRRPTAACRQPSGPAIC